MNKRRTAAWTRTFGRSLLTLTRLVTATAKPRVARANRPAARRRALPPCADAWIAGLAMGASGARRFRLYRPPDVRPAERLPLMVMLHGCGQDANHFAASTAMNRIARRERFLVLYPEQDRLANAQGCWNWFGTDSGRAYAEAELIMKAIDQVCRQHPVDPARVAVAGMSAGASMAALLVARHPGRFRAVVMHSGVPPGTAHSTLSALEAMRGRRSTLPLDATQAAVPGHWPPLLVIHGDADTVVSPRNGHAAAQLWATAAHAVASPPRGVQRGKRYRMTVTDFKRHGRAVVTHMAVHGLGHAWSGGAKSQAFSDERGPDASRLAWAFAARQFGA